MRRTQETALSRADLCREIMALHGRINRAKSRYYDACMFGAFAISYKSIQAFFDIARPLFSSFLYAYCEASSLTAVWSRQEIDFFNAVSEFKNINWPSGCQGYEGEAPWEIQFLSRNSSHHFLFYSSQMLDDCIKKYPGLEVGRNLFQKIFNVLLLKLSSSKFRNLNDRLPIFPQVQKGVELFFQRNISICMEEIIVPLTGLLAILFKLAVIDHPSIRKRWSARGLMPFERLQLLSQRELLKKKIELEKICYKEEKPANHVKNLKAHLTTAMIIYVLFLALYHFLGSGESNFIFVMQVAGIMMINGNLNFNPWGDELSQTEKKLLGLASQFKEITTVTVHEKEISWVKIERKNEGNSGFSCLFLHACKHKLLKPKRIMTALQATLEKHGIIFDYDSLSVVIAGDVSLNKVDKRSFKVFFARLLSASINLYQITRQLEEVSRDFSNFCQYSEGCIIDETPAVRWSVLVSDQKIRQNLKDILLDNKIAVMEWKNSSQTIEADFLNLLPVSLKKKLISCLKETNQLHITETSHSKVEKRNPSFVRQKKSLESKKSFEQKKPEFEQEPEKIVWDEEMVYPENYHIKPVSGFNNHYIWLFLPQKVRDQYCDVLQHFLEKATQRALPVNKQGIKNGSYFGRYFNGRKDLFPARLKLLGGKGDMTFFLQKKQAPTGEMLYSICGFGEGIH